MTQTLERPARRRASGPRGPRGARPRSRVLTWVGRLLLTAGVLIGLYGVYELFVTDVIAESERTEIAEEWRTDHEPIGHEPIGTGGGTEHREDFPVLEGGSGTLGMLHVPRWDGDGSGDRYEVPIGAGSGDDVLDSGQLGHYSKTQPIGGEGNAGLSGHRTTHGKPLREVHQLQDGDALVVESEDAWLVYRVVARDIVKPHQSEVLDPIPPFEGADQTGTGRYLTLTTCDPIFGITDRYIIWAEADYWTPKSEGLPPALT
ncbi:class E sortase [Citricoccus nitrophenolicus]|uniref:class E sortase n=1 Tax=Citricoccus nitrophenolicus TaxID=863575 RepID=UPI0031E5446D